LKIGESPVALEHNERLIRRRPLVPGDIRLPQLHDLPQRVMGRTHPSGPASLLAKSPSTADIAI
jgi:hypothetical protein